MTLNDIFLRLIQINRPLGQRVADLDRPVIVSLTSYGHRLETCHLTLSCLLAQTVLPNKIILWLTQKDSENVPESLKRMLNGRISLGISTDLRSYKKLIPSLINFPGSYIVTVDDDWYFPPTWLSELISAHDFSSSNVTAHRVHMITRDGQGAVMPYHLWKRTSGEKLEASADLFPTNGAGTLFPPGSLHPDVLDVTSFQELAPTSDDIWIYCMLRKAGNMCRSVGSPNREFNWPGSQVQSLWEINRNGGNDQCISKLSRFFETNG